MNAQISIGGRVKNLRERIGLSQTQIGDFLGVDQTTISKCENDEREFTIESLDKLCGLFGCQLSSFLEEQVPENVLQIGFRSSKLENEDLEAIAAVTQIVMDIDLLENIMRKK